MLPSMGRAAFWILIAPFQNRQQEERINSNGHLCLHRFACKARRRILLLRFFLSTSPFSVQVKHIDIHVITTDANFDGDRNCRVKRNLSFECWWKLNDSISLPIAATLGSTAACLVEETFIVLSPNLGHDRVVLSQSDSLVAPSVTCGRSDARSA